MYKDNGGGLVRPDKVASPASGATVLMGFFWLGWLIPGVNPVSALISIIFLVIFLIRVHQCIYELMQSFAHLSFTDFHQQSIFQGVLGDLANLFEILLHHLDLFRAGDYGGVVSDPGW